MRLPVSRARVPDDEVIVPSMTFRSDGERSRPQLQSHARAGRRGAGIDVPRPQWLQDARSRRARGLSSRCTSRAGPSPSIACSEVSRRARRDRRRGLRACEWRHSGSASTQPGSGDFGAFSFYVTKNVVAPARGAVLVTDDGGGAARAKRLALHGLSADAWIRVRDDDFKHYEVEEAWIQVQRDRPPGCPGAGAEPRVERNLKQQENLHTVRRRVRGPVSRTYPRPSTRGGGGGGTRSWSIANERDSLVTRFSGASKGLKNIRNGRPLPRHPSPRLVSADAKSHGRTFQCRAELRQDVVGLRLGRH